MSNYDSLNSSLKRLIGEYAYTDFLSYEVEETIVMSSDPFCWRIVLELWFDPITCERLRYCVNVDVPYVIGDHPRYKLDPFLIDSNFIITLISISGMTVEDFIRKYIPKLPLREERFNGLCKLLIPYFRAKIKFLSKPLP
jgi:hypothetical protein